MRSLLIVFAAVASATAQAISYDDFDLNYRSLADSDNETCIIEQDTDFYGNDIANVLASSYAPCCDYCLKQPNCTAWSWSNYNDGTCWLKNRVGRRSNTTGVVGGYLPGAPTQPPPTPRPTNPNDPKCTIEYDVDYEGNDIANVPAELSDDCCGLCNEHTNCTAWSWNTANGGTCWLKNMVGFKFHKSGNVVGALPNAPTEAPSTERPLTPRPTTSSPLPSDHVQWKLRAGVIPARAVNLGGWLVAEYWMTYTSPAWEGLNFNIANNGEYYAMRELGLERGTKQFEAHRSTWITEKDIEEIAVAGLNAVRVPIGFWIVNDDPSTNSTEISRVFAPGALKYLDVLVNDWAVKHNIAVMVSLHAHQGSQNGNDHSAAQEIKKTLWSNSTENIENSIQFATFIAERYHHSEAFLGIGLMNEPSGTTPYDVLKDYYERAYALIRGTGNDCILSLAPLLNDQNPPALMDFMVPPKYTNVEVEFHKYYQWGYEGWSETDLIAEASRYRPRVLDQWVGKNPLFIGEWSLGTTFASSPFKNQTLQKEFAQTQLDSYEAATAGWSFWAWRNDEEHNTTTNGGVFLGWSMRQLVREGILTVPKV